MTDVAPGEDIAIGIDLGTTFSCVCFFNSEQVEVIANKFGRRTTPSIVAYTAGGERLVGEAARNQAGRNPKNTVYDAKRLIGRRFDDLSVQEDAKLWPFNVVANTEANGMAAVEIEQDGQKLTLTPEEISAAILMEMKFIAEDYLGRPVTRAVVTVPAYFNDAQRQATKDAGVIAGLHIERIINEPTAAALAYGLNQGRDTPANLLIFDLGGGTLDVTVLTVDGGVFEVLATSGDTHLGGEDFDNRLVEFCANEFEHENGRDMRENPKSLRKLKEQCQEAKHTLSLSQKATIEIDSLFDGIDFVMTITRQQFEEMCSDLFEKCLEPVNRALGDAGLDPSRVDEVVLIGGSTRVVEIQRRLSEHLGGKPLCKRINPDEAVAMGAAIQAANLTMNSEAKARSAKLNGLCLMDVTPLSLGIELANGKFSVLVSRNTSLPYSHKKVYKNNEDGQTEAHIEIYEGESERACENRLCGKFTLRGLPPRPRGTVSIEVAFTVDSDGILEVTAEAMETGVRERVVIDQNKGLLTSDQVEQLAEKYRL